MPRTFGVYCSSCGALTSHLLTIRKYAGGLIVRCITCRRCGVQHDLLFPDAPGVVCPKCSHTACRVLYVRHRRGITFRARKCTHCGHRFRTAEQCEHDPRRAETPGG